MRANSSESASSVTWSKSCRSVSRSESVCRLHEESSREVGDRPRLAQAVRGELGEHGAEALEDGPEAAVGVAGKQERVPVPPLAVLAQQVEDVARVVARAVVGVGLERERGLEVVRAQHVENERDGPVLPALAAPPRQGDGPDAGLADPARVLLEDGRLPDVVGPELRHVARREIERRTAFEVVPVLVIGRAAVPGVVLEDEVPLEVGEQAAQLDGARRWSRSRPGERARGRSQGCSRPKAPRQELAPAAAHRPMLTLWGHCRSGVRRAWGSRPTRAPVRLAAHATVAGASDRLPVFKVTG